jgi:hypothetical protein
MQEKRNQLLGSATSVIASALVLPLQSELRFNARSGLHELVLETTVPLFCVVVMATNDVTFLDSPGSVAIMTRSKPLPGSAARALATYRCDLCLGSLGADEHDAVMPQLKQGCMTTH